MTTVSPNHLADAFVEVADTLVDEFDLIEFLQMVTTRATELVGAQAAGLLLADHRGTLQHMASTDEEARLLELFQVQSQEGPCHDCYTSGEAVINADLATASDRWPLFAPRAVDAGLRSVHAIPLRLRSETIGALNLFGSDVGRMEPADVHIVQALADVATIGLLHEQAVRRAEVLTEQLQNALNSRILIEQAKGALAQFRDISVDAAFEQMRRYARENHLRLGQVAEAVLNEPASLPELTSR